MSNEVWKEFAEHSVSHSMAHYLTTISDLHAAQGYARVSDVARELDVTKGSASVQVKHLKEKGLVAEDDNRHLQLTESGQCVARRVMHTRFVLIRFLSKVLGVDERVAETDACKVEHLLSPESCERILALVRLCSASDDAAVQRFLERLATFRPSCPEIEECFECTDVCMLEERARAGGESQGEDD